MIRGAAAAGARRIFVLYFPAVLWYDTTEQDGWSRLQVPKGRR